MSEQLPWLCLEHPHAQIRHEWDRTEHSHTLNGERVVFSRSDANHRYLCALCGRRLAAPGAREGAPDAP